LLPNSFFNKGANIVDFDIRLRVGGAAGTY